MASARNRGRTLQRAGPLHGVHRLRVELDDQRRQPAPQCAVPRRHSAYRPGAAVLGTRQPGSGGPVALPRRLRARNRRRGARHTAQRESLERRHVQRPHSGRRAAVSELRPRALALGAGGRGHTDERRWRDPSAAIACRRIRRLRDLGPDRYHHATQATVDARWRVRTLGAAARHRPAAQPRREPLQLRHDRQHRLAHGARDRR